MRRFLEPIIVVGVFVTVAMVLPLFFPCTRSDCVIEQVRLATRGCHVQGMRCTMFGAASVSEDVKLLLCCLRVWCGLCRAAAGLCAVLRSQGVCCASRRAGWSSTHARRACSTAQTQQRGQDPCRGCTMSLRRSWTCQVTSGGPPLIHLKHHEGFSYGQEEGRSDQP